MEDNRILAILREEYEHKISSVEFLRNSGGTAYVVSGEKEKFLLKITTGEAFKDTICQSADVVSYLSKRSFPVPAIIETKSGLPLLNVHDEGREHLFVLYEYIDGKEPDICACGEKVGELVGRLHKLLLDYKGGLTDRDYQFFIERYVDILRKKNYPHTDIYADIGARLWERVKSCPVGVCHGDLHRGNLLETADGKIYLLDFDTICIAPRMFDVAVMCDMTDYFHLQIADIKTTMSVYKDFLAGYSRCINLTEEELATFNDWIAIRHFQLQATIVELFGMDCIDNNFIDRQLQWLEGWEKQSRDNT